MANTYYYDWDASWTTTSINASTVTNSGTAVSGKISNDTKISTEISIDIDYGGTATQGVFCYLLRDIDGTNFESASTDEPFGFELPYAVSSTRRRTFQVSGDKVSDFKIHLSNSSGADVTATVRYRQCVSESV